MTVSVERISDLKRKMTVSLPESEIEKGVAKELQELTTKVKIKGFRPGKVPLTEVKRRFASSVRAEVINRLIGESYEEAIKSQELKPASAPQVDFPESKQPDLFTYEATFEVYPELELKPINGVSIEKVTTKIEDADVNTVLDKMRAQHASWSEVDRPATKGDKLTIDFVGSIDGVEFDGGKAEGFELELGSNSMIPGFESGLEGAKPGAIVTVKVTFPEEYHAKDLSGKAAEFAVTVKKILGSSLPELNEEFAQKYNIKEGGIATLRADVLKNISKEVKNLQQERLKTALMDKLVEINEFDVPVGLVDREIERMKEDIVERFAKGNKDLVKNFPREHFADQAVKNVKIGLIFSHLVESQKIEPTNEQVLTKLAEFAESYENAQSMIDLYKDNKEAMEYFRSSALEDAVVDKLLADVKITEKAVSYDEFMNPKQKEV